MPLQGVVVKGFYPPVDDEYPEYIGKRLEQHTPDPRP